ncbi:MAG: serine hydrolase [Coriobacteriales bacterium]|jgi:CubicO group peptidase (beta-lactamase class C family)|nr:serine hydrolase [Coriobacteriales bacterium]
MIGQADLKAVVDDVARRLHLPSACVGVSLAGEDRFYATGHRAFLIKRANTHTVYRLASCSKAFIATAVMLLQEEHLLDIDEPVVRSLPNFALYCEELTAQVTPRDMLSHRTGLPRHDISSFANQQRTLAQMAEKVRYLEPAYGLRERFHYQNHMYGVLSLLVERVQDRPWGQFVQERILEPLGMSRTYTSCAAPRAADDNYARPLVRVGRINLPYLTSNDDSTGGAGSLSASVRDLLCWAKANLGRGNFEGREVFPPQIFTQLHAPQTPLHEGEFSPVSLPFVSHTAYALGWFTEHYHGELLVYHGGTIFGFKSMVGFLPEHDFAFAILINQDATVACDALARTLCDKVLGVAPYDWVSQCEQAKAAVSAQKRQEIERLTAAPETTPSREGLAGRYGHPAYGTVEVTQRGNRLALRTAGLSLALKPSRVAEFAVYSKLAAMAFPCYFERRDGTATALLIKLDEDLESYIRFERLAPT